MYLELIYNYEGKAIEVVILSQPQPPIDTLELTNFLLGPREQINQNSAFIDAAHIYGEHNCQGRELRSGFGGRMNATRHPVRGKDLLPQSPIHPECKSPSGYCFIAGKKSNE